MATAQEKMVDVKVETDLAAIQTLDLGTYELDPETDRKIRWKIDLILMPLLCITYALQSIDKTTLSYAAVFGIKKDLHLSSIEYSWTGGIFYLGYLIFEYPANVVLQKFPINKVLAGNVICWGIVLMCHAAVNNFASLAALRTLLGAFECCIQPATMILFGLYYKRDEQPFRMGIWIGAAGLGYVAAGISSFGIGHIKSGIVSWKWTFLIWGIVTTTWGVVLFFFLPGPPQSSTPLFSQDERERIVERVKDNGTGLEDRQFKTHQFKEAICDLKTWLLFLFAVASNAPNGGLTTFQGLMIKALGFSTLQTTLIQMPSGALQFVFCTTACYLATKFRNTRLLIMLIMLLPFLAGLVGQKTISLKNHYARLACIWISFSYTATWTISMSVVMANTAGRTKKGVVSAVLIIGYSLGNFVGPFFFKTTQSPDYILGVVMMFVCIGIQVASIVGLWLLLIQRNRSKIEPVTEDERLTAQRNGFADMTDFENPYFRYLY